MKRVYVCIVLSLFLASCNTAEKKVEEVMDKKTDAPAVDLPYTASYSSSWTADVSDADLKAVLVSYKDWETGNMPGLEAAFADTVTVEMNSGDHLVKSRADLIKYWGLYRDSLSNIRIDMEAWQKMYSTDKKDGYVVTWYKEYDTYKDGRVDSASYHDINQLKDGKITWYSQFKRKLK